MLREPLLYPSLYLKQHRGTYYELLDQVRVSGDWEAWVAFFLEGMRVAADGAVHTTRRLLELFADDRSAIEQSGRRAGSALRVYAALRERPILSITAAAERAGLSFSGASAGMKVLANLGVAREITGRQRGRLFVYDRYVAILNEGTEATEG